MNKNNLFPDGTPIDEWFADAAVPSSDAIDIDVCTDVLIKDCYIEVCDDAVVLKGGKQGI